MATGVARARDHRERQIAEVLGRYELAHLADVLGLERLVSAAGGLIGRGPPAPHTEPENLRLALEELGPTFIKLGQLLSTGADLLSPDFRAELSKLQDAAPTVPSEVVEDIVERELHAPADSAFATFEAAPLACASVGQAHTATLYDGTDVVVKVRRPNVVENMEQDFEIIQNLAARASRYSKTAARYDAVGLAHEFVHTLRALLDYLQEARNAERFSANFAGEALAPYVRRHLLSGLTAAEVGRRLEQFGIDLAELTAELPTRLNRISEAIETGGLEIHLRTDEMDGLLARVERLGNRVAASVLTAALIEGLVQLATWRRRNGLWRRRRS